MQKTHTVCVSFDWDVQAHTVEIDGVVVGAYKQAGHSRGLRFATGCLVGQGAVNLVYRAANRAGEYEFAATY